VGAGGALWRVSGTTPSRVAAFDGAPRAVMVDATHAYIITPTKILRTLTRRASSRDRHRQRVRQRRAGRCVHYVVGSVDKARVVAKSPRQAAR